PSFTSRARFRSCLTIGRSGTPAYIVPDSISAACRIVRYPFGSTVVMQRFLARFGAREAVCAESLRRSRPTDPALADAPQGIRAFDTRPQPPRWGRSDD